MNPILEKEVMGDFLLFEEDAFYSRELVTVVSGAGVLHPGTVVGKITASGKVDYAKDGESNGLENPIGVLAFSVDATSADAEAVIINRHATVSLPGLIFDSTVDNDTKRNAMLDALLALGIKTVKGA